MLTKRKKQNLIFLFLGLLLGMLVCCIVFYFNVLKGFMQDSVNSIQALRSQKDTVRVVNTYYYPNAREANRESLPDSTKSDEDSLSLEESEDIILTDRMLASASIAVMRMLDDSTVQQDDHPNYLQVEQWENPMHFLGYKKIGDHLIIYGLDIDEIELYQKNKTLYLKFRNEDVPLKESESFIRFPASFLHQVNYN